MYTEDGHVTVVDRVFVALHIKEPHVISGVNLTSIQCPCRLTCRIEFWWGWWDILNTTYHCLKSDENEPEKPETYPNHSRSVQIRILLVKSPNITFTNPLLVHTPLCSINRHFRVQIHAGCECE